MGSIDIIKHLSTILSRVVSKSQQHQDKNSWESRESNLGQLVENATSVLYSSFQSTKILCVQKWKPACAYWIRQPLWLQVFQKGPVKNKARQGNERHNHEMSEGSLKVIDFWQSLRVVAYFKCSSQTLHCCYTKKWAWKLAAVPFKKFTLRFFSLLRASLSSQIAWCMQLALS